MTLPRLEGAVAQAAPRVWRCFASRTSAPRASIEPFSLTESASLRQPEIGARPDIIYTLLTKVLVSVRYPLRLLPSVLRPECIYVHGFQSFCGLKLSTCLGALRFLCLLGFAERPEQGTIDGSAPLCGDSGHDVDDVCVRSHLVAGVPKRLPERLIALAVSGRCNGLRIRRQRLDGASIDYSRSDLDLGRGDHRRNCPGLSGGVHLFEDLQQRRTSDLRLHICCCR